MENQNKKGNEAIKNDSLKNKEKIRILFVCLGNICRSPAADGIMQSMVDRAGLSRRFVIDSAGTGNYHVGDLPDSRMRAHARRRGNGKMLEDPRAAIEDGLRHFNQTTTAPFKLSLSMGLVRYNGRSTESFLNELDQKMYAEKKAYHQEHPR